MILMIIIYFLCLYQFHVSSRRARLVFLLCSKLPDNRCSIVTESSTEPHEIRLTFTPT